MIKKYSFTYKAELIEFDINTKYVEIFKNLFGMQSDEQFISFLKESFERMSDGYELKDAKYFFENNIQLLLAEEATTAIEILFDPTAKTSSRLQIV